MVGSAERRAGLAWFVVFAVIATSLSMTERAAGASPLPADGTVLDLGTLGGPSAGAAAVNEDGIVVGSADTAAGLRRAFSYDLDTGVMVDLGTLGGSTSRAVAINDHGVIVGNSFLAGDAQNHAFRYDPSIGVMEDLGTLGGASSFATSINNDGIIVGWSSNGSAFRAFCYDPGVGHLQDIGSLGGPNTFSFANAINDAGVIVGNSYTLEGDLQPFWRDPGSGLVTVLPTFGGSTSLAYGLNASGVVVGQSQNLDGVNRPYAYDPGTGELRDLGVLPGGTVAQATAVSDAGIVVGSGSPAALGLTRPIAWNLATGERSELPTLGGAGAAALDINESGIIVGYSQDASGAYRAVAQRLVWLSSCGEGAGGPFLDVSGQHGFCEEIAWLAQSGASRGFPDGTFRPTVAVSRQAMAAFLHRTAGTPAAGLAEPFFADVGPDHQFYGAIQWMAVSGLSTGTPQPAGKPLYKPADPVSRQAMAAFLHRFAGELPVASLAPSFADVAPSSSFYGAIQWMAESGLSAGTPQAVGKPLYKPFDAVSRQAMAAFLFRYDALPGPG